MGAAAFVDAADAKAAAAFAAAARCGRADVAAESDGADASIWSRFLEIVLARGLAAGAAAFVLAADFKAAAAFAAAARCGRADSVAESDGADLRGGIRAQKNNTHTFVSRATALKIR